MTEHEDIEDIPNPDIAGLIPYFTAPADEPNPDDREDQQ